MAVLSRFDELRYRTDKQLFRVVNNVLDDGLSEAREALRSGHHTIARHHYLQAKRRYVEAAYLILLADARMEPQAIHARLDHLRETLEAVSVLDLMWTPAGDDLAALTHAVSSEACERYCEAASAGD